MMNNVVTQDRAVHDGSIASLDDLYREAERLQVTPGWISRDRPIFWKEPRTDFVPAHWHYQHVRSALASAGNLIDVAVAERRNLIMRNPFPANNFATVRTRVCAYQMILPGDGAPSHRHSSHALRLVRDAKRSSSVVNDHNPPMYSGHVM